MSKLAQLFYRLLEKQKACMAACLTVSLVSGSICAASILDAPTPEELGLPASAANVSQVQAAKPETREPVDDGSIPDDDCMYVFYSAWEGYEFKPSEFSDEYEVGDEIKVTVTYNRSVGSQIASNVEGEWTTFPADGRTLEATLVPDDDWLNLQITDMKEGTSVGVVSIDIEITLKNAAKLKRMNYTAAGDYLLFAGGFEEAYETDDLWLSYCDDTDWLTLVYDCNVSGQEGWGILGWGGSLEGEWINGPGYGADKKDSTAEVSVDFSVKYLRRMMGLSKSDELDFTSLGAWGGGRIKSLTLHRGSLMPRSDVLFENGEENEEWVCKDLEQILDEDGSRFLCLKYTCSEEENYGWSVLGFGAGVGGEWKSGPTYKVSEYQPTRDHYDFLTMDEFRASMGLSWEAKVDSVSLGAYNNGRILKLWLSDTPALDPGDDVEFEKEWESPNAKIYEEVAYAEGTVYPQNMNLAKAWEQAHPEGEAQIIENMGRDVYIVVTYESKKKEVPTLYVTMKDDRQSHVKAVWSDGKKAVFSYDCIARMFEGYLIPEELKSIAVSTGEHPMTVTEVKTVVNHTKLEEEPLAVLTKNWSGFEAKISDYHPDYQPGDTVKVTVKFDKTAPGTVAFHIDGKWKAKEMQTEREFSVTATPDDDYMSIQIGEIPRTKAYVIIRSIKVEIVGKTNYKAAVVEKGSKTALLADSMEASAKAAGLTDAQIKDGKQLIVTTASVSLNQSEGKKAKELLESYSGGSADYVLSGDCVDITLALADKKTSTPLHETKAPLRFKVPAPSSVDGASHDFGVIRLHGESADLLPDLDDEDATITFASDRFSRFVVVYGPKDCFKELRGDTSIHTFTGAWSGWEIRLNDYIEGNVGFGAGDTVRVTVEFNKETSSEINTNVGGAWTRLGAAEKSKVLMVTGRPDGDTVALQITDMMGEKSVKVMKVKVEIVESAPLPVFTGPGDAEITLNKFLKDFTAGSDKVKITVHLNSDGAFRGNLEGNTIDKTGAGWNKANGGDAYESEGNRSTYTWIAMPQYGSVTLKIYEMSGKQVKVDSVTVERTDEEEKINLPVFTKAGSKSLKLTNFLTDLVPGTDYVKVTVKLSSDGAFKGNLEGNTVENNEAGWRSANGGADYESVSGNTAVFIWSMTPQYPEISLKISEMSGSEVKVDSVTVERTSKPVVVPEEVLFTIAPETSRGIKLSDYQSYNSGDKLKVTIKMNSDRWFQGEVKHAGQQVKTFSSNDENGIQKVAIQTELVPTDDILEIVRWGDGGSSAVKVTEIKVKIVGQGGEDPTPGPEKPDTVIFTLSPEGTQNIKLSEYQKYSANDKLKVTVKMNSDHWFQGEVKNDGQKIAQYDGKEVNGVYEETVQIELVPANDILEIARWGDGGNSDVKVTELKIEIVGGDEPIYTLAPEGKQEIKLSEYQEYSANDKLKVTINMSSDRWFQGEVKNGNQQIATYASQEVNGVHEETIQIELTPADDILELSRWGDGGTSDVKVTDIKVEILEKEQKELHTFTEAWAGFETTFSDYLPEGQTFVPNRETSVTLTFDQSAKAQAACHQGLKRVEKEDGTFELSNWFAETGTGNEVTLTLNPEDDYLNVQITDMAEAACIKLLGIAVTQSDPVSICECNGQWQGVWEFSKEDYPVETGKNTVVKFVFDKEVKVQFMYNDYKDGVDKIVSDNSDFCYQSQPFVSANGKFGVQTASEASEVSYPVNLLAVYIVQWDDDTTTQSDAKPVDNNADSGEVVVTGDALKTDASTQPLSAGAAAPSTDESPKADDSSASRPVGSAPAAEETSDADPESSDKEDAVIPEEDAEDSSGDETEGEAEAKTENAADRIKEEEQKEEDSSDEDTFGQEASAPSDSEEPEEELPEEKSEA